MAAFIYLWNTNEEFREMAKSLGGQSGDIVIPVYLGGTMLDEVIVNHVCQ